MQRDREMTGQTEVHISRNYHTTTRSNKTEIIIVAEATVFLQTLAVLPPTPIILGITHFDTEVQALLSSSPELKLTYKC